MWQSLGCFCEVAECACVIPRMAVPVRACVSVLVNVRPIWRGRTPIREGVAAVSPPRLAYTYTPSGAVSARQPPSRSVAGLASPNRSRLAPLVEFVAAFRRRFSLHRVFLTHVAVSLWLRAYEPLQRNSPNSTLELQLETPTHNRKTSRIPLRNGELRQRCHARRGSGPQPGGLRRVWEREQNAPEKAKLSEGRCRRHGEAARKRPRCPEPRRRLGSTDTHRHGHMYAQKAA